MDEKFAGIGEYRAFYGGTREIRRLLIANNGNAAMKMATAVRHASVSLFEDEGAMEIVGIGTMDDVEASAEYISRCDYLARAPTGPSENNFSNLPFIRKVADDFGCDGIWAGWGHASEDYELPRLLENTPCQWIGPPARAMEALGCKIGSTLIAQTVGVPVVPWTGIGIQVPKDPLTGNYIVDEALRTQACIDSVEALLEHISEGRLELPLMIKAAAGGGGKGIRVVQNISEIPAAFHQVVSEVSNSLVFAMSLIDECRHLEVQILADEYGTVLSMGTRDCSIQRRHQKIIEEGPPICTTPEILRQMEDAAVAMCQAVRYINAATVEFLFDVRDQRFYFLEVNARLQVEHVVTELLTDVDLPWTQIAIAMGISLLKLPQIQRYLHRRSVIPPPTTTNVLQLSVDNMDDNARHVIAARITAEDPEKNFQPTCGTVAELNFESSKGVWAYFGIRSQGRITQYSDSQFGHIFAAGRTREEARKRLLCALQTLIVRGDISTNVELLEKIFKCDDYKQNKTFTTWLERKQNFFNVNSVEQNILTQTDSEINMLLSTRRDSSEGLQERINCSDAIKNRNNSIRPSPSLSPSPSPLPLSLSGLSVSGRSAQFHVFRMLNAIVYASVFRSSKYFAHEQENFITKITQGQIARPVKITYETDFVFNQKLKFQVDCFLKAPNQIRVTMNESSVDCEFYPLSPISESSGWYFISGGLDGRHRRVCFGEDETLGTLKVTFLSNTYTFSQERDPSQVRAPVSGKLARWLVDTNSFVEKGTPYAEVEIMKLYVQLSSEETGVLNHVLTEGAIFAAGDLLASLDLPPGKTFSKPSLFRGQFPPIPPNQRSTVFNRRSQSINECKSTPLQRAEVSAAT